MSYRNMRWSNLPVFVENIKTETSNLDKHLIINKEANTY